MLKGDTTTEGKDQELTIRLYYALTEFSDTEQNFCDQMKKIIEVLEKEGNEEIIRKVIQKELKIFVRQFALQQGIETIQQYLPFSNSSEVTQKGEATASETKKELSEDELRYKFLSEAKKKGFITPEYYQIIIELYQKAGANNSFREALKKLRGFSLILTNSACEINEKYVTEKDMVLQQDEGNYVKVFFLKSGQIQTMRLELTEKELKELKFPTDKNQVEKVTESSSRIFVGKIAKACDYVRLGAAESEEAISELLLTFNNYDVVEMLASIMKLSRIYNIYLSKTLNKIFTGLSSEENTTLNNFLIAPIQRLPRLILLVTEITKQLNDDTQISNETLEILQSICRKLKRITSYYNEYMRNTTNDPFHDDLWQLIREIPNEIANSMIGSIAYRKPENIRQEMQKEIKATVKELIAELEGKIKKQNDSRIESAEKDAVAKATKSESKSTGEKEETSPPKAWQRVQPSTPANTTGKPQAYRELVSELYQHPNTQSSGGTSSVFSNTDAGPSQPRVRKRDMFKQAISTAANNLHGMFRPEDAEDSSVEITRNSNGTNNNSGNSSNPSASHAISPSVLARMYGGGK